jgi:hypothetical protein
LGIVHKTLTFVVASDVAFEQIVDAVEQDVGAVEHIEVVAQCEVIFVQPERDYIPRKKQKDFFTNLL